MVEPYTDIEAVKVIGDSMDEVYSDGAILFVTPALPYVAQGGKIDSGLDVIVHSVNEAGRVESTVKRLEIIKGEYWLVPKSTNPSYQAFQISSPNTWTEFDQDHHGKSFVAGVVLCEMQKRSLV
jgi:SOS-response transcriptional repressor LexA